MGAQFAIKDERTVQLARDLAKSVSDTIREALEEKARAREADFEEKLTQVREASREFRVAMPDDWRDKPLKVIMDEIYDERGLPK